MASGSPSLDQAAGRQAGAWQVVELTEEGRLQQQCVQGSQRRTCFMAFLPALLDTQAAGRQKLLQVSL